MFASERLDKNPAFSRRGFGHSVALFALSVLSGCYRRGHVYSIKTSDVPVMRGARVDAHCHLFNASDLPVRRFVQRVILEDGESQVVLGDDPTLSRAAFPALAGLLVKILSSGAPTASAELRAIERGEHPDPMPRSGVAEADVDLVQRALEAELSPSAGPGRAAGDAEADNARQLLRELIARETGVPTEDLRRSGGQFAIQSRALLSGDGRLSYLIKWAALLTRSRREIIGRYLDLYGRNEGIDLFMPAMIDFSVWLDNEEPESDLMSQIQVIERLQRTHNRPAMHALVAFDPWRQVQYELDRKGSEPLALVRQAIEKMGFLGVKLYPPMGFLPIANAQVLQTYPSRAAQIPDFPTRLDSALIKLYEWCEAEGVPLLAHASPSNGAADGYSRRADPAGWITVLKRFPKLRVSLAHFGGFEEGIEGGLAGSWEERIGQLLNDGASNLFADLSYFRELLPGAVSQGRRRMVGQLLEHYLRTYDPGVQHLMYGSDWVMLGTEPGHERYRTIVEETLATLLDLPALQRCMGGNAIRWLGLNDGEKAHARIIAYRKHWGLDTDWLTRADAA